MADEKAFDREVALVRFVDRKTLYQGTTTDNSAAYAGSPMVYHCRHCEAKTETLPETHREKPRTECEPCKELVVEGAMDEAKQTFERGRRRANPTTSGCRQR